MINIKNITLYRGARVLIEHGNLTIFPNQCVGLIGENGSGKSSLLQAILGFIPVDKGEIDCSKKLKIAYLKQEILETEMSAIDFVLDGDTELRHLETALIEAEHQNNGEHIAVLHQRLHEIDAYTARSRAAQLLSGLGFSHDTHDDPVRSFSGGWRIRLNLAQVLMTPSDVLLLDEPTNHLDLDALLWLEKWVRQYAGIILLISHDRDFLDQTATHIAFLKNKKLTVYSGNYSSFEKQYAEQLTLQQAVFEKQQKKIQHLQKFVDRFRAKASKAKQAQSRLKAIERIALVDAVHEESPYQFKFKPASACKNPYISIDFADIGYSDAVILKRVSLSIAAGDRIGVLGFNGAGKSTLIKYIAGLLSDDAGCRTAVSQLKIGYFAQHQVDELSLSENALFHLKEIAPTASEQTLRAYLGSFGFSDDKIFQEVRLFSGGEKSRLALSLLIWQEPNLILLDEPTNHLDLEVRHALMLALQEYEGALILISHDRFLMKSVVDQFYLVHDGSVNKFDGDLDSYAEWMIDTRKKEGSANRNKKIKVNRYEAEKLEKTLLQKIKTIEEKIKKEEVEKEKLDDELGKPEWYESDQLDELKKIQDRKSAVIRELACLEEEWTVLLEEWEKVSKKD